VTRIDRIAQRGATQRDPWSSTSATIERRLAAVAAALSRAGETALQAQLCHIHPLGNFGSFQSLVLRQRRVDAPEKASEEALPGRPEIGVIGAVPRDHRKAADSAAELPLSFAHAHPEQLPWPGSPTLSGLLDPK